MSASDSKRRRRSEAAQQRARYWADPEAARAKARAWRAANAEALRARARARYWADPEAARAEARARQAAFRAANPPKAPGRKCSVCSHPRRRALDAALQLGRTARSVATEFGGSYEAVKRHRANRHHLPKEQA